jgi:hypothetical protein
LYAWGYFKNKPTVVDLTARFKEYDSAIAEEEVHKLLNTRYFATYSDEFYLEEVEVIENDMGF